MKNGTYALVTGATSGIGAEFARQLAAQGYNLVITGRRKKVIESVARGIRQRHKNDVIVLIADLTKEADVKKICACIKKLPALGVLVNNAGFGHAVRFLDDRYENQEAMIRVHVGAPTRIIHAAAPLLAKNKGGAIINVSSIAAMLGTPGTPLYAATKAYLNAFSDSLAATLRDSRIRVQALCPGFTKTDFHGRMGMANEDRKSRGIVRWMSPEKVARISLRALRRGRVVVVPGFLNRLVLFIVKIGRLLLGTGYYRLAARVARKFQ